MENLKIGDFTTGVNWSGIRYIYLGFTDESSSLPSSLYNDVIEYRNVCDLIVTPKNTDGDIIIYNDGIVNSFGDSENSLVADITERFSDDFDSKDISKVDIIKVDFYIPDYSLFTEFTKQNKLEISFVSKKGIKYMPTYHPAALLRDEIKKIDFWNDLELVKKEADENNYII